MFLRGRESGGRTTARHRKGIMVAPVNDGKPAVEPGTQFACRCKYAYGTVTTGSFPEDHAHAARSNEHHGTRCGGLARSVLCEYLVSVRQGGRRERHCAIVRLLPRYGRKPLGISRPDHGRSAAVDRTQILHQRLLGERNANHQGHDGHGVSRYESRQSRPLGQFLPPGCRGDRLPRFGTGHTAGKTAGSLSDHPVSHESFVNLPAIRQERPGLRNGHGSGRRQ